MILFPCLIQRAPAPLLPAFLPSCEPLLFTFEGIARRHEGRKTHRRNPRLASFWVVIAARASAQQIPNAFVQDMAPECRHGLRTIQQPGHIMRISKLLTLLVLTFWTSAVPAAEAPVRTSPGLSLEEVNAARAKLDAKPELRLLNACPVDATACTRYGVALMRGSPTLPKDPVEARKFFDMGCTKGDASGCRALGMAQQGGLGGPADLPRARVSYATACFRRDAEGCARFGDMMAKGLGGPTDEAMAKVYWGRACDYGAAKVCTRLGRDVPLKVK